MSILHLSLSATQANLSTVSIVLRKQWVLVFKLACVSSLVRWTDQNDMKVNKLKRVCCPQEEVEELVYKSRVLLILCSH